MGLRDKLKWLDPFTYVDEWVMPKVNPNDSQVVSWAVYLFFAVVFAWLLYTGLGVLLGTGSPMVIVLSPSMEPVMFRGDVIVMTGVEPSAVKGQVVEVDLPTLSTLPLSELATVNYVSGEISFNNGQTVLFSRSGPGDIVVYNSGLLNEAIIHRVVVVIKAGDGYYLLTKGDNNDRIDQDCNARRVEGDNGMLNFSYTRGCVSIFPVRADSIEGRSVARIPLIGYVKLLLFDDLQTLLFGCRRPGGCPFP